MITSQEAFKHYGDPTKENNLVVWDVPSSLEIGVIPKKVYCNKDLILPLSMAFSKLIDTGYVKELKTWDGCFNLRPMRGYEAKYNALVKAGDLLGASKYLSAHCWGIACDMNASHNSLGKTRAELIALGKTPFSEGFLNCFRTSGFDCGADFKGRPDFMHVQLAKFS